jgi:hypothetical protein
VEDGTVREGAGPRSLWAPRTLLGILLWPLATAREQRERRNLWEAPLLLLAQVLVIGVATYLSRVFSTSPFGAEDPAVEAGQITCDLAAFVAFMSAFWHVSASMFGGRGGYRASLRSLALAAVPCTLAWLCSLTVSSATGGVGLYPVVVALWASSWALAVMIIAFCELHRMPAAWALPAVGLPVAVLTALGCVMMQIAPPFFYKT